MVTPVNPCGTFPPCIGIVPGELDCCWMDGAEAVYPVERSDQSLESRRQFSFWMIGCITFINDHIEVTSKAACWLTVYKEIWNSFSKEGLSA